MASATRYGARFDGWLYNGAVLINLTIDGEKFDGVGHVEDGVVEEQSALPVVSISNDTASVDPKVKVIDLSGFSIKANSTIALKVTPISEVVVSDDFRLAVLAVTNG